MRAFAFLLGGALLLFMSADASANIITSESNLEDLVKGKGPGVSATVDLSGVDTETIYTTPASGSFFLTQLCGSQVDGGVVLAVTGFGTIAQTGSQPCVSFPSGAILPKNATLTCSTTAAATPGTTYFCSIMGFSGKK